jgi:hypothetical protein
MSTLRHLAVACPQCGHLSLLVSDHLPAEAILFCALCGRDMGEWRFLAPHATAVDDEEPSETSADTRSRVEPGESGSGERT